MDRRTTLKLGGVSMAYAASAWISWSLGASQAPPSGPSTPISRALERARATGKPVLVLIAPAKNETAPAAPFLFAQAWICGDASFQAALALCEVACATREQLIEHVGQLPPAAIAGLIEERAEGKHWVPLDLDASVPGDPDAEYFEPARRNAAKLREAVAGPSVLPARVAAARRALPAETVARAERCVAKNTPLLEPAVDESAALILSLAPGEPWATLLQKVATHRIWRNPPAGARWVNDGGCGRPTIEFLRSDDDAVQQDLLGRLEGKPPAPKLPNGRPVPGFTHDISIGALCGMGSVPHLSGRFLFFYTDEV